MEPFDAINQRRSVKACDPTHRFTVAADQPQVTDAALLIVLTADLAARKKSPERSWRNAPPEGGHLPLAEVVVHDRFA